LSSISNASVGAKYATQTQADTAKGIGKSTDQHSKTSTAISSIKKPSQNSTRGGKPEQQKNLKK
jgi:hypothetical protein